MMRYKSKEVPGAYTIRVLTVTPEYLACQKEVDKLMWDIKKLMATIETVLRDVIPDDDPNHIKAKYHYCLLHTISFALDQTEQLIIKHGVVGEDLVKDLRDKITDLCDEAESLFNQGNQ